MKSVDKKNFLEFGASVKPKQKPEDYTKIRLIVMKRMATPTSTFNEIPQIKRQEP